MKANRRGFLGSLLGGSVALAVKPEALKAKVLDVSPIPISPPQYGYFSAAYLGPPMAWVKSAVWSGPYCDHSGACTPECRNYIKILDNAI